MHKRKSKLVTIQVTRMTYRHLCDMAWQAGLAWPGMVVDKMIRTYCTARHDEQEVRRGDRRRGHVDPR